MFGQNPESTFDPFAPSAPPPSSSHSDSPGTLFGTPSVARTGTSRSRTRDDNTQPLPWMETQYHSEDHSMSIGRFRVYGQYDGRPLLQLRKRWEKAWGASNATAKVGVDLDLSSFRVRTFLKLGKSTPVIGVEGMPVLDTVYGALSLFGNNKVQMRMYLGWNFHHNYPSVWFRMKSRESFRPRVEFGAERSDWSRPVNERADRGGFDYRWKFHLSPSSILKVNTGVDLYGSRESGERDFKTPVKISVHNIRIKQYITGNPFSANNGESWLKRLFSISTYQEKPDQSTTPSIIGGTRFQHEQ